MIRRLVALTLIAGSFAAAHEVPDDVSIRIFIRPEGNKLRFLVRVPVNALIDTQLPMSDGPGYLIIPESIPMLPTAAHVWVSDLLQIQENGSPLDRPTVLQTRLSRIADNSFTDWDSALAHANGPDLAANALVTWDRAALDVLLEVPVKSAASALTYRPRFGRLGVRVNTTLTYFPPGGGERTFAYEGDPEPYQLNPDTSYTAARFFKSGFNYFLDETDNLLFLFCAALLLRSARSVISFAAAFSVSHAAVLIAAAWHTGPAPAMVPALAATAMALTVVFLALESVVKGVAPGSRWMLAAIAGIFFGGGFWLHLDPLVQFGGINKLVSVLSFTAGIEVAEALALFVMVPVTALVFRLVLSERIGTMILAGIAAHIAWHRMTDRAIMLNRLPLQWPAFGVADIALLAAVFAAGWFIRFSQRSTNQSA